MEKKDNKFRVNIMGVSNKYDMKEGLIGYPINIQLRGLSAVNF